MRFRNTIERIGYGLLIILTVTLLSGTAIADMDGQGDGTLSGEEISDLIAGNTVMGSMSSGDKYAEFYAEDGTIRGDGYTGKWSIDGDAMCFDYGDGETCYHIAADDRSIQWILDGEIDGTGTVREGNPMDF